MRRSRLFPALLLLFVATSVSHAAAGDARIDLRQEGFERVEGDSYLDLLGSEVAPAGDLNGGGSDDFLLAACGSNEGAGKTYVIFNEDRPLSLHVTDIEGHGFVILGADNGDRACSVSGIDDLNGDGLDEVLVGAALADPAGRTDAGTVYVVYGKTSSETVDLRDFDLGIQGDAGYRIDGAGGRDLTGQVVASIEDLTGDGLDEIVIAAPFLAGVYVVSGEDMTDPIDLMLAAKGFGPAVSLIRTPSSFYNSDYSLASVGDVNGDGQPDIAFGLQRSSRDSGTAWVAFDPTSDADVRDPSFSGFKIRGDNPGDSFGVSLSAAGDIDRDGLSDVLIGAPRLTRLGPDRAYVVRGTRLERDIHVSESKEKVLKLVSDQAIDFGTSVAGGGDLNGDGRPDFVIGAPYADPKGRFDAGSAFVVSGRRGDFGRTLKVYAGAHRVIALQGDTGRAESCEFSPASCPSSAVGQGLALFRASGDEQRFSILVGSPGSGEGYHGRAFLLSIPTT